MQNQDSYISNTGNSSLKENELSKCAIIFGIITCVTNPRATCLKSAFYAAWNYVSKRTLSWFPLFFITKMLTENDLQF